MKRSYSRARKSNPLKYKIGDYIWAKLRGFPFWPAVIVDPPPEAKNKDRSYWVYFFGSKNYSWIDEDFVEPYEANRDARLGSIKNAPLKRACEEIEDCISRGELKFDPKQDPFDKLLASAKKGTLLPRSKSFPRTRTSLGDKPSPISTNLKSEDDIEFSQRKRRRSNLIPLNKTLLDETGAGPSSYLSIPRYPKLPDVLKSSVDATIITKNVKPSSLKFGIIGSDPIGVMILKALQRTGHEALFWCDNRYELVDDNVAISDSLLDIISMSDVIFVCVKISEFNDFIYGANGLPHLIKKGQGVIETTTLDSNASLDLAGNISTSGGRYLELRCFSKVESESNPEFVLLAAGDRLLYDDCESCFSSFGENKIFLGEVGKASILYLSLQAMETVCTLSLIEVCSVSDSKDKEAVMMILSAIQDNSSFNKFNEKIQNVFDRDYTSSSGNKSIKTFLSDLKLLLDVCNRENIRTCITEVFLQELNKIFGIKENSIIID